eukprot:SAG22_NODE_269_length_13236_cov_124.463424_11_plen_79_part_00
MQHCDNSNFTSASQRASRRGTGGQAPPDRHGGEGTPPRRFRAPPDANGRWRLPRLGAAGRLLCKRAQQTSVLKTLMRV